MKAVVFDNELKFDTNYAKPLPKAGEALIKVNFAGICNTDYEITKGYMGYVGVLGHEFVGVVEEVNSDKEEDKDLYIGPCWHPSELGHKVMADQIIEQLKGVIN